MKRFMFYSFAVKQRLVKFTRRLALHISELAGSLMKRGKAGPLRCNLQNFHGRRHRTALAGTTWFKGAAARSPATSSSPPYSISTALGMTYAGANGQTAQENGQHAALRSQERSCTPRSGRC